MQYIPHSNFKIIIKRNEKFFKLGKLGLPTILTFAARTHSAQLMKFKYKKGFAIQKLCFLKYRKKLYAKVIPNDSVKIKLVILS